MAKAFDAVSSVGSARTPTGDSTEVRPVKCAFCNSPYVHGTTLVMMQSQRFPSVFIHGSCRARLFWVLQRENIEFNSLVNELIMDDKTGDGSNAD